MSNVRLSKCPAGSLPVGTADGTGWAQRSIGSALMFALPMRSTQVEERFGALGLINDAAKDGGVLDLLLSAARAGNERVDDDHVRDAGQDVGPDKTLVCEAFAQLRG